MSRPKLYTTKAQHREANREKNKRFYHKNRVKILDSKKETRLQEKRAQEQQEIKERKKRREQRNRANKRDYCEDTLEVSAVKSTTINVVRELEERTEDLKQRYTKEIQPDSCKFLDKLTEQALNWKRSTRGPLMTRNLAQSPVAIVKKTIENILDEYCGLEDEYLYCTRDRKGKHWEAKRAGLTLLKEAIMKLLVVLDNMNEMLNLDDYIPTVDDLKDLYCYQYI
ncbi:hypothetical protein AAF712_009489 [Marasmius tenuissimus]|uniref:Uncharacterized protein n=1 Tax=Marasmius tenuissimus TaxID=585030 RepID=A0ABR2ZPH9_9AGAR|nr:hypothetical protein PM082_024254 [Marasmius tenuissimus]